ncbi:N-methyl-L-tryptophan oxidase [Heyndrickxia ginsengihumi]|uniref:N-methyl-L-tryptophan oxidase n=1 Tax=Heyndrickxia ginsengihumi TaxID=363870 RepID=UPI00046EB850|nr:N-methyl-L-tryptophan oxidase [Heyndrickxia ginsengihumi]
MNKTYDVIVIGLGGMGSAAAYHLMKKGLRVLGIDRFQPPHQFGSSHGHTRIFREAYLEGASYVPLAQRAHALWRRLEEESGKDLLAEIGGVMIGPENCEIVQGTITSAKQYNLPYEMLSAKEMAKRFPAFYLAEDEVAVYEKTAGVLFPEACIEACLKIAISEGLEIKTDERVLKWGQEGGGITVYTEKGIYKAEKLVISAGAWNPDLFGFTIPLEVQRKVPTWFQAMNKPEIFNPDQFPIFCWRYTNDLNIYGMPGFHGEGTKVAFHQGGLIGTADGLDREVSSEEIAPIQRLVAERFPDLNINDVTIDTCFYTNTPDGHFVLGKHPNYDNVAIAGGFSGHGFKFCSVIGEILSDLVIKGKTNHDITLFDPVRFQKS